MLLSVFICQTFGTKRGLMQQCALSSTGYEYALAWVLLATSTETQQWMLDA